MDGGNLGLMPVVVTAANADDGTTASRLLAGLPAMAFLSLAAVWADNRYRDKALDRWLAGQDRPRPGVTRGPGGKVGADPLPKPWVVEQTFGSPPGWRRLLRQIGRPPGTSAALVKLASISRMARRARPPRWRKKSR